MFELKPIARQVILALGGMTALAVAGVAAAQAPRQLERVEITGSLIRRVDAEAALPVTVVKADDLQRAGVTNAEQALQFVAQNNTASVTANSVGTINGGAAFADLRGLGESRTLVLVNGRRIVNNPYLSAAVDLNALPMAAIDRIEVLTDGASAIYGTDAIAGVINFVTRKSYEGMSVGGDIQIPRKSGGTVHSVNVAGGWGNLDKDRWNVFGGLSYRKQQSLTATQRDFARTSVIPGRGVYAASPVTFPANYSQGAVSANPAGTACRPPLSLYLPDIYGPDSCAFDYVPYIDLIPRQEQLSAFAKASFAINKDHTVALEYLRAENKVTAIVSPSFLAGLSMSPSSPFYPGNGITAANPDLDTTQPVTLDWRTTVAGGRASRVENVTDRLLLDFTGKLGDWDYRASAYHSEATVKNIFTGGYLGNDAIRAGMDGADGAPFLDPFGDQTAAAAAYIEQNRILGELQRAKSRLQGISVQANTEVADLPAGPLALALGAEYSREENRFMNNFALIQQAASSGLAGAQDSAGRRDMYAMVAELNIPVVKNLDFNIAGRYDHYSDFGGTFNPKISFRWQPMASLLLRGSYNTGFRAPTLQDAYAPHSLTYTGARYNDQVLCPGGAVDTAAGGVATRDCNTQFQQQQGGNRDLKPEKSKAWSVGFVVQPARAFSFGLDYWDYTVRDSIGTLGEQAIFGDRAKYANLFVRCSQASASERGAIDACQIPGGDPLAYVVNTTLNLGEYRTSGVDVQVQWQGAATSYGRFSAGLRATYVATYRYQFEPGGDFYNNAGIYFNGSAVPRYKHIANFGWQYGDWSSLLMNRFTGAYTDANAEAGVEEQYYGTVGSYSVWDWSVTYTGFKNLTLTAGALNLLDARPPFSNQLDSFQIGYDQRQASPLGRTYLIRAGYRF
jgi:iron complex outermembrane receptor protein